MILYANIFARESESVGANQCAAVIRCAVRVNVEERDDAAATAAATAATVGRR